MFELRAQTESSTPGNLSSLFSELTMDVQTPEGSHAHSSGGEQDEPPPKRTRRHGDTQGRGSRNASQPSSPAPFALQTNVQDLTSFEHDFFARHIAIAESRDDSDAKRLPLPLSRIKRVMRQDPDVKLIAGEVPYLFTKLCEIFIAELSARAWIESARRVTLTRADVAAAISRSDAFDFLVDIVPREEGVVAPQRMVDHTGPAATTWEAPIDAAEAMRVANELFPTMGDLGGSG